MGCRIIPASVKLKDAPQFVYLESLDGFEDVDEFQIIYPGTIVTRMGKELIVIASPNESSPDGFDDFTNEEGLSDLLVRVMKPGERIVLEVTDEVP